MPSPFDPFDTFGDLFGGDDPFGTALLAARRRKEAEQAVTPPTPEAQESALSKVGGGLMSGLHFVGGSIGKALGGRALKAGLGALAGEEVPTSEFFSWIPFSDTLHLTDERNAVTGKRLNELWGVTEPGDNSWGAFGKALATDLLTDPITFATFGGAAVTPLGKAATKLGVLPRTAKARLEGLVAGSPEAANLAAFTGKTVADVAGKRLGGHVGFGVPFMDPLVTLDLSAPLAGLGAVGSGVNKAFQSPWLYYPSKVATFGVGPWAVNKAKEWAPPVYRGWNSLFEKAARGTRSAEVQPLAREMTEDIARGTQALQKFEAEGIHDLAREGLLGRGPQLREFMETHHPTAFPLSPAQQAATHPVEVGLAQEMRLGAEARRDSIRSYGVEKPDLTDKYIRHASRQARPVGREDFGTGTAVQQAFPTSGAKFRGRMEELKDVPEGSKMLNSLSVDDRVSGIYHGLQADQIPAAREASAGIIRQKVWGWDQAREAEYRQLRYMRNRNPTDQARFDVLSGERSHSTQLANEMGLLDPRRAKENIPLFGNHPIRDHVRMGIAEVEQEAALKAGMKAIAGNATDLASAGKDPVALNRVLDELGVSGKLANRDKAYQKIFDAADEMMRNDPSRSQLPVMSFANQREMANLFVPRHVYDDVARMSRGFQYPDALKPVISGLRSFQNLFKAWTYAVWPASRFRDFISNTWQNHVMGSLSFNSMRKVDALLGGNAVKEIAADMAKNPYFRKFGLGKGERALTDEFVNLAHSHGLTSATQSSTRDFAAGQFTPDELIQQLPGLTPQRNLSKALLSPIKTIREKYLPESWATAGRELDPRNVIGFGNRVEDLNRWVKTGRELGDYIDNMGRLSGFYTLLKKGWDPAAAAQKIKAGLVDYQNLSHAEQQLFRTIFPFYTYTRAMIPWQLRHLAEAPGRSTGTALRAGDLLTDKGFVPPQLGPGLAIPTGEEEGGNRRFISSLGLPFEVLTQYLRPLSVGGHFRNLLAQINPIPKFAIEQATGRQLFSGRDLSELYRFPTGNTLLNNAIANSPLARVAGTYRAAVDPRKDWADLAMLLGTGARVTDVDMPRARLAELRRLVDEATMEIPSARRYEVPYVPRAKLPELTDEQLAIYRLNAAIQKLQKEVNSRERLSAVG